MIRLGHGSTIIRILRNRIESATSSQSGTPQPASQPHLPAAAKYRLLAWLGSSNVHAILQFLQEIRYTPPSCARRSLQAFPSGAAWCIRPRGVYAILRILREMTYTPPSCARVVYMPFSVFCEKWRIHRPWYTPPSCHLFFLSGVCSLFRMSWAGGRALPLRDHSGWEGPHAQEAGLDGGLIVPSSPKLDCGRMKLWLFLMNWLRAAWSFCLCCNFCGSKERLQGI